jgi:type I restriction enzyme S subunit
MGVRLGYKQTEVGVIPEDWEVLRFGEVFDFLPTASNSRSELNANGDTYYIHYGDIHTRFHGHLDFEENQPPKINRFRCKNAAFLKNGDWIMADASEDYNGVGKAVEVQGLSNGIQAIAGLHTFLLREKKPLFSRGFKGHLGQLAALHGEFLRVATGLKVFGVTKSALRYLSIPIPPLPEQTAIAGALGDVDALLAGLSQLIAKKRTLKQAALHQLLTAKTRLPGFSGEWQVKRLGEHLTFLRNGMNSRAELTSDGPVKYLHYGDIHGSHKVFMEPIGLPSLPAERARTLDRLRDGDLVFADASEDIDGVGKSVEISETGDMELVSGLHTIAVRFDKAVLADSFKANLQFIPEFQRQLRRLVAGTKVLATNRAHIASIEIPLPDPEEQTAIAAVLSDMDAEISALERRLEKTRDLKQAMMQELLTGRIRLI